MLLHEAELWLEMRWHEREKDKQLRSTAGGWSLYIFGFIEAGFPLSVLAYMTFHKGCGRHKMSVEPLCVCGVQVCASCLVLQ